MGEPHNHDNSAEARNSVSGGEMAVAAVSISRAASARTQLPTEGVLLNKYLFIESRCDQEGPGVPAALAMAGRLCIEGNEVTMFLVQNAIATAARSELLTDLIRRGVHVWVDDFSNPDQRSEVRPSSGPRRAGVPDLVRLLATRGVVPIWQQSSAENSNFNSQHLP